ncbi:MAG TPA: hypothetical protein VD994_10545 [Prosthecobacter sp.]|nr:hypothetical protein [Prosthecobacter sp.]
MTQAVQEVIEAVTLTGGKGEVSIKLKFERFANQTGGAVKLRDEIATKIPRQPADPAVFFVTEEFTLTTEDPSARTLPLRTVDEEAGELRRQEA